MATSTDTPMSKRVTQMRWLALVCHVGLIVWMTIWYFALAKPHDYSITFIVLIYLVPLLFPLYGVLKGKPYTHAWASFVVLFYFLHAITVLYAEPTQIVYASIELILAIGMFTGCSTFARLRGQELGMGLRKLKDVMDEEKQRFEV